jgi:DNA polymerase I-like protein with 3'-5' exonuclease and polymerase domains
MQGQGLGAIISKYILIEVYEYIASRWDATKDVMPILFVHDEYAYQVREDLVEEFVAALPEICRESVKPLQMNFPIEIEIYVGNSWANKS